MTTYYVATLARYVLVDAEDESRARDLGRLALHDLYAEVRDRLGKDVPIEIRTVREATEDEIELWTWHLAMLKSGGTTMTMIARPGDRIRLLAMHNDPNPIPAGQVGTVVGITHHGGKDAWDQIDVAWDNGRTLMLVSPPDVFEIVGHEIGRP